MQREARDVSIMLFLYFQTEGGIRCPLWARGFVDVFKRQVPVFLFLAVGGIRGPLGNRACGDVYVRLGPVCVCLSVYVLCGRVVYLIRM